jgi:hypothetical protein
MNAARLPDSHKRVLVQQPVAAAPTVNALEPKQSTFNSNWISIAELCLLGSRQETASSFASMGNNQELVDAKDIKRDSS